VSYARLAARDPAYREKALASADRVLELSNPSEANYSKALQLAGRQLVELGREEEAVNRFKRLVEEDPSNYQVIQDIGMDLLNTEKWKGAAIFLGMTADARQKVGAEDFDVYYNVGLAHYKMRAQNPAEIDEAIAWYEKALTVRPDEPTAVFNIEVAYVAKEDWTNAGTWGEKYITLQPSDPQGWQLLARIYSELGEKEKANEALQRYQQLQG
jgi:tetratricopeptide (TPR) repeat protein